MTSEEILTLAIEVGFDPLFMEKFTRLVENATLERAAVVCDSYEEWCGGWGLYSNQESANEGAKEIAAKLRGMKT